MRPAQLSILLAVAMLLPLTGPLSASTGPPLPTCGGTDPQPGATLLVPYFEIDLNHPAGRNTLFSVNNTGPEPALARVVLWSDLGLPTFGFTMYLGGGTVQSLDLRALLVRGTLPVTGSTSFPRGASCTNPIVNPRLDEATRADLQAKHTGQPSPVDGLCHGTERAESHLAVGYITVDAVNDCSSTILYPGDDGYFDFGGTGLASNENVLWGDVYFIDVGQDSAQAVRAVALRAEESNTSATTFYRIWVDQQGTDQRQPLGFAYRSRFLNGGSAVMETDLLVWTEGGGSLVEPFACGDETVQNPVEVATTLRRQDGEIVTTSSVWRRARTFRESVGTGILAGATTSGQVDVATFLHCGLCDPPPPPPPLQTWVTPILKADERFSVALEATRLEGPCQE